MQSISSRCILSRLESLDEMKLNNEVNRHFFFSSDGPNEIGQLSSLTPLTSFRLLRLLSIMVRHVYILAR